MLGLFLFNVAEYRIWFYYAQQQADIQMIASLEQDEYNAADLITIKIPINLPYQSNWKEFERVDGEVNIEGKIYKYIKRKVQDGEPVLLCLPDKNKTRLTTAKMNFLSMPIIWCSTTVLKNPAIQKMVSIMATQVKALMPEDTQNLSAYVMYR